jgi:MFS family permease
MGLAAVAFGCVMFATPATGLICFLLYNILHGAAMGGINSALTNLVFDYSPVEQRSDSLAFCQSVAGVCGFVAGVLASRFVGYVQGNGNQLFGIPVFAQQVTSLVAMVLVVFVILYITVAFRKKKQPV